MVLKVLLGVLCLCSIGGVVRLGTGGMVPFFIRRTLQESKSSGCGMGALGHFVSHLYVLQVPSALQNCIVWLNVIPLNCPLCVNVK